MTKSIKIPHGIMDSQLKIKRPQSARFLDKILPIINFNTSL